MGSWLAALGAWLLAVVVSLAGLFGAVTAGVYVAERSKRRWLGVLVGVILFALLAVLIAPGLHALKHVQCQAADDVRACLGNDAGR